MAGTLYDKLKRLVEESIIDSNNSSSDSDGNDATVVITVAEVHKEKRFLLSTEKKTNELLIGSCNYYNKTGTTNMILNAITGEFEEDLRLQEREVESEIIYENCGLSVNEELLLANEEINACEPLPINTEIVLNENTGIFETVKETAVAETSEETIRRGKKRRSKPKTWNKNKKKSNRLREHQMRTIPICRCNCQAKLSVDECKELNEKFINLGSHTEQNIFLQGCVRENVPKRFRPRTKNPKTRRTFEYKVEVPGRTIVLCLSAFNAVFGLSGSRLRKKVLRRDQNINDGRGKHDNHFRKLSEDESRTVHDYISGLPAVVSHYSRSDNKRKKYLSADLSIAELHRRFLFCHQDLKHVSYENFREIFNYDFNIGFGVPRKDICNTCEKLKVDIKSAELEKRTVDLGRLKKEKELHQRKAEVFFEKLKALEKDTDENNMIICFDYQKNLPLPVTNVQDEYYRRQLWLHNFGIHDVKNNTAVMYLYTENYAQKGPNEVITALEDYIVHNKNPTQISLTIFCDNCFSQNKNKYLFTYLDQLCAKGVFHEVTVIYPTPGHSMMPIDRDFAQIERKRLRNQSVYTPEYYVEMIKNCKKVSPFQVVYLQKNLRRVENEDERMIIVKNYKRLFEDYIKPVPNISKTREVKFSLAGRPSMRLTMTGPLTKFALYRTGVGRNIRKVPDDAYHGPLALKSGKVKDVLHLLNFVPNDEKYFYKDNIFAQEVQEVLDETSDEDIE